MVIVSDIRALTQWIRTYLQTPLLAGDQALEYARNVLGSADLGRIMSSSDSSEVDSLLDLIFFPDFSLQKSYEKQWGATPFSPADQKTIVDRLKAEMISSVILTEVPPNRINLQLPSWIADAFVQRLNITWQPAPSVEQALHRHQTIDQQITTRVHLRNATKIKQKHHIEFFCRFIKKMPASCDDYITCLRFVLSILPEFKPSQSAMDFLISKKECFFRLYCKVEAFELRRSASNMETLMLQRERAAHGSLEQWRKAMHLTDRICNDLFGFIHSIDKARATNASFHPDQNGWDMMQTE